MRTLCGTILAAAVAAGAVRADVPKTVNGKVDLAKAEEVHVRKGAGNFLAKMKAGKPVTVATLVKKEPTDTSKYDGTWFQPCQIMVVGRILK